MSSRPGPGGELIGLFILMRLKFQDVLVRTRTRLQHGVAQTFALFSVVLLLLWISVFLYGSLYYSYMPNVAFSTAVHYYQRYVCELTCTGNTHTTHSAVSSSAGQAVNHMHPFCALIHWQMCLWQGTRSMYVCMYAYVYIFMQFMENSCNQNVSSGSDFWASLSDLSADGNAWFSGQSGSGDVHDQDNILLSGWRPDYLLSSTCA